jgi:hypothetical protein
MSNDDEAIESIEVTSGQRPIVRLSKETPPASSEESTHESVPAPSSDSSSSDGGGSPSLPLPSWLRKGTVEPEATPPAEAIDIEPPAESGVGDTASEDEAVADPGTSETSDGASIGSVDAESGENDGSTFEGAASEESQVGSLGPKNAGVPEMANAPLPATSHTAGQTMAAVSEWAQTWNVDDDPYVSGLVAALGRRDNMTMWASMDPMEMLPEPEIRSGNLIKRIARVLTVIRNVLVFVPVALTWLSIQHATEAFGRFVRDPSNGGREYSFLQFWQDPQGYLEDFWRIQDVARLDASLILMIVAATLIANILESRHKSVNAMVGREIQKERMRVGLLIAETLQGNKSASPESITESLALALNDLSQAARDVSLAAARMEAASVGIDSLSPRIENLNVKISDLDRRFGNDVVKSVNSLVDSVSTLGVAMGGDMQKFVADVLSGLEEVNEGFKKTFVAVEFGTKQLRDDLDAIHRKLKS